MVGEEVELLFPGDQFENDVRTYNGNGVKLYYGRSKFDAPFPPGLATTWAHLANGA